MWLDTDSCWVKAAKNIRVMCLEHPRTIHWRNKWKKAHTENQNIHLARYCIQPLFFFYMTLLKCLSYILWTHLRLQGMLWLKSPSRLLLNYMPIKQQSLLTSKWKDKYSLLIWRFEVRHQTAFKGILNLWSSLKSPSGQMTHVHMFKLQAGAKLKRLVLGFIFPMRLC